MSLLSFRNTNFSMLTSENIQEAEGYRNQRSRGYRSLINWKAKRYRIVAQKQKETLDTTKQWESQQVLPWRILILLTMSIAKGGPPVLDHSPMVVLGCRRHRHYHRHHHRATQQVTNFVHHMVDQRRYIVEGNINHHHDACIVDQQFSAFCSRKTPSRTNERTKTAMCRLILEPLRCRWMILL